MNLIFTQKDIDNYNLNIPTDEEIGILMLKSLPEIYASTEEAMSGSPISCCQYRVDPDPSDTCLGD